MSAPRVASLLPSATEMICAVGMEEHLVGVSHECDWPPSVVGRPVLTSSRLSMVGASGENDRDLRALLQDALAVYAVDDEALEKVRPDVIVTQDLCDVCAVAYDDVLGAVRTLTNSDVRLVNLHPKVLQDIWDDLRRVGAALGASEAAERSLAAMDARVASVRERVAQLAPEQRPHTLTIEWIDPVMVGGMWMPELVEIGGGRSLVTSAGEHAPTLDEDALRALDPAPDVVLVKPCGFPLAKTLDESGDLAALLARMPWPAIERGAVWVADGNAYFNRPGPRIVDSLEILAACMHPQLFADFAELYAEGFRRFGVGEHAPSA